MITGGIVSKSLAEWSGFLFFCDTIVLYIQNQTPILIPSVHSVHGVKNIYKL